jgi:translocation and assembly module TamA
MGRAASASELRFKRGRILVKKGHMAARMFITWMQHARGALAACLVALLCHGAQASEREPARPPEPATQDEAAEAPVNATYTVTINIPDENGLKSDIMAASRLVTLEATPPPTLAGLKRRTEDDATLFGEVMRSRGYYDYDITYSVTGEAAPYEVSVSIDPGDRYALAAFDIAYAGGLPENAAAMPTTDEINAGIGGPAIAADVVATEGRLVRWLRDHGYPYANVVDRLALANHPDKDVWVQVTVETGPLIRFGELSIDGLERTDPDLVERNVDWQVGDIYDQQQVDDMRDRLIDTGVFASVVIQPEGDASGAPGERQMDVAVAEGPPRSLNAGVSYDSNLGPEVHFGWEHRNLWGEGEVLTLRTSLGTDSQRLDSSLRKPDFMQRDQDLIATANLINEQTDAYNDTGVEAAVLLERPLARHLRGSAGIAGDFFKITNSDGPEQSLLFGLPVNLNFDNSDSLLNPTTGFRLAGNVTPWAGQADTPVQFLAGQVTGTTYLPLDSGKRVVIALRGQIGSIWGTSINNVPANQRYYAGGGGSVRGYEYQHVGPLDANNNPEGGKSLAVFNSEVRLMVTEDFGIVPFFDAGNVYESTHPDFSETFFKGTGLGLRYVTPVGPVRFDFAVPLDRRDDIDDPYQFYISLGQAF